MELPEFITVTNCFLSYLILVIIASILNVLMGKRFTWYYVIFLPYWIIYSVIAIALLSFLYGVEKLIEKLGNYSEFPGLAGYSARKYLEEGWKVGSLVIIFWPLLAIRDLIVFGYAIFAAFLTLIYDILDFIWSAIVESLRKIWNLIIDSMKSIWEKTIESIEDIWRAILGQDSRPDSNPPNVLLLTFLVIVLLVLCYVVYSFTIRASDTRPNPTTGTQLTPATGTRPNPTIAQISTATFPISDQLTVTQIPTPFSSQTPTVISTNTPIGFGTVIASNAANLRAGPGTDYGIVGTARRGEEIPIYAKSEDGLWLQIAWPGQTWIAVELVESSVNISSIPIATPSVR